MTRPISTPPISSPEDLCFWITVPGKDRLEKMNIFDYDKARYWASKLLLVKDNAENGKLKSSDRGFFPYILDAERAIHFIFGHLRSNASVEWHVKDNFAEKMFTLDPYKAFIEGNEEILWGLIQGIELKKAKRYVKKMDRMGN